MWAFDSDTMCVFLMFVKCPLCEKGFSLALVAMTANTVRSCMLVEFLGCNKAKVTLWTFGLFACTTVCIDLCCGWEGFTTFVAGLGLSCEPDLFHVSQI